MLTYVGERETEDDWHLWHANINTPTERMSRVGILSYAHRQEEEGTEEAEEGRAAGRPPGGVTNLYIYRPLCHVVFLLERNERVW